MRKRMQLLPQTLFSTYFPPLLFLQNLKQSTQFLLWLFSNRSHQPPCLPLPKWNQILAELSQGAVFYDVLYLYLEVFLLFFSYNQKQEEEFCKDSKTSIFQGKSMRREKSGHPTPPWPVLPPLSETTSMRTFLGIRPPPQHTLISTSICLNAG